MSQVDYISLIHKQLSKDISAEELVQLQDWINESEDNKMTADSLALVWGSTEMDDEQMERLVEEVDVNAEFDLLNARITADEKLDTKVIPMWRKYIGLAAGLAILIGVASVVLLNNTTDEPQWAEFTTQDETAEIKLADGSIVNLNANSSLKYPVEFTGATREVELSGEAFFDISKDAAHPFTVHTPYEDVSVLGTSFNVRAYSTENESEVAVTTGKVKVDNGKANQILLPNEKVIVYHETGAMIPEISKNLNENAWLTNKMVFEDASMPEVLDNLEAYFDIEIDVKDENLLSCPFNASFNFAESDDLSTALTTISKVFSTSVEKTGENGYILVGGSCQ